MVYSCCVPGCTNTSKDVPLHRFPHTDELAYNEWLNRIGNTKLRALPIKRVYGTYRVCHLHFHVACTIDPSKYSSKSGLKQRSLPAINVPGFKEVATEENSFVPIDKYRQLQELPLEMGGVRSPVQDVQTDIDSRSTVEETVSMDIHDNATTSSGYTFLKEHMYARSSTPVTSRSSADKPIARKDIRRRFSVLQTADLKKAQLSPKAKRIYAVAKKLHTIAYKADRECRSLKERLRKAEEFMTSADFLKAKLNKVTFDFVCGQIKQQSKKPKGRRFSIDEKIFAVSLMKRSPRGYKLLEKMFALPSRKTLTNFLSKIPYRMGINEHVLQCIKATVASLDIKGRYCVLAFDEIMLEAGLVYNARDDHIYGFDTNSPTTNFCDHALVFMAIGIYKKWKQPLAYFFSKGPVTTFALKQYLLDVIHAVQLAGLKIVATVCDQFTSNCKVYSLMTTDTKQQYFREDKEYRGIGFEVNGEEIVPLFDPPHLLKGIRNNLLENDVSFIYNGKRMIASWKDITAFYELDVGNDDTKMCNKLSDIHIYKEKIKKMKVSLAAQVFSRTVSAVMRGIITHGSTALPNSALGTADFLLFMNKLFDSVNGASGYSSESNNLKCAVQVNTSHLDFWTDSIAVLNSLYFIKSTGNKFVPPSVRNWQMTIEGFKYLWRKLQQEGMDTFPTRSCNQDPLENFFGQVRSQGYRNVNPTCFSFATSFKTLIINNFMSPHSINRNCEEDLCEGALNNLRQLLNVPTINQLYLPTESGPPPEMENIHMNAKHAYIAGFICKKLRKYIQKCVVCKEDLITTTVLPEHCLIQWKSFNKDSLLRPTTNFTKLFCQTWQYLRQIIALYCHRDNLKCILINCAITNIHFSFRCEHHNLRSVFFDTVVKFFIHTWINNINNILKGRVQSSRRNSVIAEIAYQRYLKYKIRKRQNTTTQHCSKYPA